MRDTVALEDAGIPTVTVISTTFAPLAQVVAESGGYACLPIVVVPHPVGDRDEGVILHRGTAIAAECARILTTAPTELEVEFRARKYPLSTALMPR